MPMPARASAIYGRIQAFAFDASAPGLPFHRQLARENGWTSAFAARAISEYRRFLLLAVCAEHPVTPSDTVEQVWRLHLIHTRSYWERLCKDALGRALHHQTGSDRDPGRPGADHYSRTLATYRQFFDAPAPSDIWPAQPPGAEAGTMARIDRRKFFLVRKPWR